MSTLSSLQSPEQNMMGIWQDSDETKDDTPWAKDQRQVHVKGPASQEYTKNMPDITSENMEDQHQVCNFILCVLQIFDIPIDECV
jgi:hypothetical protein